MPVRQQWYVPGRNKIIDLSSVQRLDREAERILKRGEVGRRVPSFFSTKEWVEIRYRALKRDKGKCQCCGRSAKDGVVLNVDHIKSRTKYPHLALKLSNLQVLCSRCNKGKGWKDATDWRKV